MKDEDIYVDLGDDSVEDIDNKLTTRIDEVVKNGLIRKGAERLEKIVKEHKSVLKNGLGSAGPVKVPPMEIVLDPAKKPVKVNGRKYHAEQRWFLNTYFSRLVEMGFLKPCPQASW